MADCSIIDFYNLPDFDYRAIIESTDKTTLYSSQVSPLGHWCSCVGYNFTKNCKHLGILYQEIEKQGKVIKMLNTNIPTSIKALNQILGDGIPQGILTWFYGKPQSAKTTSAIWTGLDAMKETKQNVLFVDMETGAARHVIPKLIKRYNKKFDTDFGIKYYKLEYRKWIATKSGVVPIRTLYDDKKEIQMVVLDISGVEEALLTVGKPMSIVDSGTRITLQRKAGTEELFKFIWDTPIAQIVANSQTGERFAGFIFDSLSVVSKDFGNNNQNYPSRDTAQSFIINQLAYLLSEYYDMFGIMIAHASYKPQAQDEGTTILGGKSVGHGGKYILEFSRMEERGNATIISVTPFRLPAELGDMSGKMFQINDNGVE